MQANKLSSHNLLTIVFIMTYLIRFHSSTLTKSTNQRESMRN